MEDQCVIAVSTQPHTPPAGVIIATAVVVLYIPFCVHSTIEY